MSQCRNILRVLLRIQRPLSSLFHARQLSRSSILQQTSLRRKFSSAAAVNATAPSNMEARKSTGKVTSMSKGIVTIAGLQSIEMGSLIYVQENEGDFSPAMVMAFEKEGVQAALMCSPDRVSINNQAVFFQGEVPSFPTGQSVFGRVFNALGEPVDEAEALDEKANWRPSLTGRPPAMLERAPLQEFLPTGMKHVDFFYPLVKGGRFGIVGPRGSQKTRVSIEVMKNHLATNPKAKFIYVLVGRTQQELERLVEELTQAKVMPSTVVIAAHETAPLPLQYLAPFAGCTVADSVRDQGGDALLLVDDMAALGNAYSYLTRSVSERWFDVGSMFARLLERVAPLKPERGGGVSTAVCIVDSNKWETQPGRLLEQLSIQLDHMISLDAVLARNKVFPPISVKNVVARPAARFQPRVLQSVLNKINGSLVMSEKTAGQADWMSSLGLQLDDEEVEVLDYKDKLQELLHQRERLPLAHQIVVMHAASRNYLAHVDGGSGARFEKAILAYTQETDPTLLEELSRLSPHSVLPSALQDRIWKIVQQFEDKWIHRKL